MRKEEGKKDEDLAVRGRREGKHLWQRMTLTPVGSLDVIRNVTGSHPDSSGMMMGFGT